MTFGRVVYPLFVLFRQLSPFALPSQDRNRHTFGTHCASVGVPLRTLQEWLGHRDFSTTLIYADYAPSPHEAELVERAFRAPDPGRAATGVLP